jgi:hypothetical protein
METKCQLAKVSILGAVPADFGHVVGIAMIDSTYQSKIMNIIEFFSFDIFACNNCKN